jgi:CspA family cold shock protein
MQSSSAGGPAKFGVTAKVKWFNPAKGFGFVAPTDGSPDAFLHVSVVQRAGATALQQGVTIVCDLTEGPRGPQVATISRIDMSTASGPDDQGPPDMGGEQVIEGEIKFFATDKGYGFGVPTSGGQDVFIGVGALQKSNIDLLESGQKVRMYIRPGKRGPQAVRVDVLSGPPPRGPRDRDYR